MNEPLESSDEAIGPERFDPSFTHHIWYEHWHRYHWASGLSAGKVVADVACGEGYGSDLLARNAKRAIGIDADPETIDAAREKYTHPGLTFTRGDARDLPLDTDSVDLLVSFETLEHLAEQEQMLSEISRVVRDDGLAVISTPDRDLYSPDGVRHNEHHVKELNTAEFRALLARFFPHVRLFGQQFQLASVIDELDGGASKSSAHTYADASGHTTGQSGPQSHVYLIAVCGRTESALRDVPLPGWHAFNDARGHLFTHYETQIERLQNIEGVLSRTQEQLRESQAAAAHLAARLGY